MRPAEIMRNAAGGARVFKIPGCLEQDDEEGTLCEDGESAAERTNAMLFLRVDVVLNATTLFGAL